MVISFIWLFEKSNTPISLSRSLRTLYNVQPDGETIKLNPHSWNTVANILYIDAPAGVGYSYSDSQDYVTGDAETATNNYAAVRSFFKKFPQFKKNDFYITGETQ